MSQSWKDNRLIIPHNITYNVNASDDPRGPYRLLPITLIDKIWRPDSFFKVYDNNNNIYYNIRYFKECKNCNISRDDRTESLHLAIF